MPRNDVLGAAMSGLLSPRQLVSVIRSRERTLSLWVGAVSAGKTIASLFAFLLALMVAPRNGDIVIIGKTLQTIERNVVGQLQNRKLFGPIADQVIHTRGSNVAVIMGRVVELVGANNVTAEEKIRGGTFGLVYVDEATLLPRVFWEMLTTRLRVGGARLIATTNPASKNHWLRTEYLLRPNETDLIAFHLTMYDNPLYFEGGDPGPSYIQRMEATYTGVFYDRFILGLWTTAEGAVYPDWRPDLGAGHVVRWEDMPPIRRVLGVSLDYGTTNPTVALMLGLTDERVAGSYDPAPRLVLMDEWVDDPKVTKRNRAPSEHAQLLRAWLGKQHTPANVGVLDQSSKPFYIVDPAAKAFREELARPVQALDGRQVKPINTTAADNSVLEGIGDVASLISREHPNGGYLLQATDRCERWNAEVTEYVWDEDESAKGVDAVVKVNDHAMDAGRYGVRTTKALWLPSFRSAYQFTAAA